MHHLSRVERATIISTIVNFLLFLRSPEVHQFSVSWFLTAHCKFITLKLEACRCNQQHFHVNQRVASEDHYHPLPRKIVEEIKNLHVCKHFCCPNDFSPAFLHNNKTSFVFCIHTSCMQCEEGTPFFVLNRNFLYVDFPFPLSARTIFCSRTMKRLTEEHSEREKVAIHAHSSGI